MESRLKLVPVPGDAGAMNGYEIKKYKAVRSRSEETLCFAAEVHFNGVHIADLDNDGRGGATFIRHRPWGRDDTATFKAALTKATEQAGVKISEPVDCWVEWYQSFRKKGIAFQRVLKEMHHLIHGVQA